MNELDYKELGGRRLMQVNYQGRKVEAKPTEFLTRKEDFNEYQLTNGKILKVKLVVTRILELEGENNPDGSQVYNITWQPVFAPVE